jgi:hypothetical protein
MRGVTRWLRHLTWLGHCRVFLPVLAHSLGFEARAGDHLPIRILRKVRLPVLPLTLSGLGSTPRRETTARVGYR